ncbi:MAG: hypothetical protein WCG12_05300 [Alcaligenaceae bacterium]
MAEVALNQQARLYFNSGSGTARERSDMDWNMDNAFAIFLMDQAQE